MKKILLFDGDFDYNHFAKMSNCELYNIAMRELCKEDSVRIMDLEEFQSYWNGTPEELCIKTNLLFFVDVEEFKVEVPDCNIEKFSGDYALYIVDSVVVPYNTHLCTMVAPKEVKEEIGELYEEGIYIVD